MTQLKDLGKELNWSDADMDAFLEITFADLEQAQLLWEESVDPLFADLLNAEDDERDNPG